jgi:hypothetical protein
MLSPQEFAAAWGSEPPLVPFPADGLEGLGLAEGDRSFLAEAGLPTEAAPFLSFETPAVGGPPTVAAQLGLGDSLRRYRVLGTDGAGDVIALDEAQAGRVVLLDHEDNFTPTFMNSSARHLAETLLAYREVAARVRSDGSLPAPARRKLQERIRTLDPAALSPGSFWSEVVGLTDTPADYPANVLAELGSPDPAARLKASKHLETELRKAATAQRKAQFGNEGATTPLVAALDDPDPRVFHNAVVALAQIARNGFPDDRAYPRLLLLVRSEHPLTARWAIDALVQVRGEGSFADVVPLCADGSAEVRGMALHHLRVWCLTRRRDAKKPPSPETCERLRAPALRALSDAEQGVRGSAASLLGEVGDRESLAALREAAGREKDWLVNQTFRSAITDLEARLG